MFAACSSAYRDISGQLLVSQEAPLTRDGQRESAVVDVPVAARGTLVAFVEERVNDVTLSLSFGERVVKVENSQKGEGLEIAVIDIEGPGTLRVILDGAGDFEKPATVHVRVESFAPKDLEDAAVQSRMNAYRAWMRATSSMTADRVPSVGIPAIDEAIGIFESNEAAEPRLAAEARAIRARMFYEFEVSWRDSAAEAGRAAKAFAAPSVGDALSEARARRLEAAAWQEVASSSREDAKAKRDADARARKIYASLLASDSQLDVVGRGRVLNDLGIMDTNAQSLEMAQINYTAALGQYQKAGFRTGLRQTARNLVLLAGQRGDYRAASLAYSVQEQHLDSIADPELRATLLINAAVVDINIGETDQAIDRLLRARDIAIQADRRVAKLRSEVALGTAYWARGDLEQATTFFQQAVDPKSAPLEDGSRVVALIAFGNCMRDSNQPAQARRRHQEALVMAAGPLMRLRARTELSRDYQALGERDAAIVEIREALAETTLTPTHPALLEARLALAEVSRGNGAPELASKIYDEAKVASNLPAEISALRVMARLSLERGDRETALRHLESAINLVLDYSATSSNPDLQAATRTSHQRLFRDYLDLRMSDSASPAERARALQVLESVRALNFSAGSTAGVGKGALIIAHLNSQLADRHVRMAELRDSVEPSAKNLESLRLEMASLRAQIDNLRKSSPPRFESPPDWRPLPAGHVQLSYALGEQRGYLWRRDAKGIEAIILPTPAAAIRAALARVSSLNPAQDPAAYDAAMRALSTLLLPKGSLTDDGAVDIVADGELGQIPFAALDSPTDPQRRLSQTHVIAMLPTLLTTSERPSAPRQWRVVTVRDSANGGVPRTALRGSPLFPALPGAKLETAAVAAALAPADGTDSKRVLALSGGEDMIPSVYNAFAEGADVLHFATHGLANTRQPMASLLSLSGELLTAGQIQEWRGSAGLVFLSACETAAGPTRFADAVPGLQRAFLSAGADNVIATLWPLEDQFAVQFAQQFYRELASGTTPAEALARTQRAWFASEDGESPQMKIRRRVAAWGYVLYSR